MARRVVSGQVRSDQAGAGAQVLMLFRPHMGAPFNPAAFMERDLLAVPGEVADTLHSYHF